MTSDETGRDLGHDEEETKIERDHPQTRKAEEDARGSADWNEDVVLPPGEEDREERREKINRE